MRKISESELVIMECFWNAENPLTIQNIEEMLKGTEYEKWKMQTISTFLHRLIEKGYLKMNRKGRSFFYSSLYKREEYFSGLIEDNLQNWLKEDHLDFLLLAMKKIDKQDIRLLKEIIDEVDN